MIIYHLMHLNTFPVQVYIDVDTPDKPALIEYSGSDNGVQWVKDWLPKQAGIFGHTIGESTTAIDLNTALSTPQANQEFSPQLIQGAKILAMWNPIRFKPGVCS